MRYGVVYTMHVNTASDDFSLSRNLLQLLEEPRHRKKRRRLGNGGRSHLKTRDQRKVVPQLNRSIFFSKPEIVSDLSY